MVYLMKPCNEQIPAYKNIYFLSSQIQYLVFDAYTFILMKLLIHIYIYVYTQVNEKHDSHNPSDRYGRYQFALDFAPSGFLTHH